MRYWLSYDFGFQGPYEDLFAWLDKMEAKECGENVATFLSDKSRAQIAKELSTMLHGVRALRGTTISEPRIYIINMRQGGKFILGKRKIAPWAGYAKALLDSGEER